MYRGMGWKRRKEGRREGREEERGREGRMEGRRKGRKERMQTNLHPDLPEGAEPSAISIPMPAIGTPISPWRFAFQ